MSRENFVKYLNLPPVPEDILARINRDFSMYDKKGTDRQHPDIFWSDDYNEEVNEWCRENISSDLYFAFSILGKDVGIHIDNITTVKLNLVVDPGGSNQLTRFFDTEGNLLKAYSVPVNRWHILDVIYPHDSVGIEPGRTRLLITTRVFP